MLPNKPPYYRTYGVHFSGSNQQRIAGIFSLGWEKQMLSTYNWDGLKRSEKGKIIFQYTLKGHGEIRVNQQTFRLKPGTAFFVNIPSDHRYYLPEDSKEWEFIHLTLFGDESNQVFQEITKKIGNIIHLDINSPPIQLIFDLYDKAIHDEIHDAYEASAYAYNFLMELSRFISTNGDRNQKWPDSISKAIQFIHSRYTTYITLDDIVEASGLSKYHFSRLFHQTMKITPLQYVTRTRINEAIKLLKNEALTIEEISQRVGFSNGNYFGKVFRSSIGVSPGKYRDKKSFIPVDQLIPEN
ncbi:AraC family transcriptional regulator [Virgibacillus profundi]|uniref:AraC family transcriptional regulator n=1 Tax=Virgibacillus profundi TaxID=2024555 RepID=UPI0013FD741F|nr:response regulator transcription factor [Virgibacillus profundi]